MNAIARIIVIFSVIAGIVMGKILTNYTEGMDWNELQIPTSLDLIFSIISSMGMVLAFDAGGDGVAKRKPKNLSRRCFFAFNTGLGYQMASGVIS